MSETGSMTEAGGGVTSVNEQTTDEQVGGARQGKRFEIEVDGEVTDERLADIERAAETLLANTVIETFDVRVEDEVAGTVDEAAPTAQGGTDHPGHDVDHLNEGTTA